MKNNKKFKISALFVLLSSYLIPSLAFAALQGIEDLLTSLRRLLNLTIPVVIGLALVYFMWGVGQFILKDAANDKTREDGKQKMLWGVIAIFVMMSILGIISWLGNTLGIPQGGNIMLTL